VFLTQSRHENRLNPPDSVTSTRRFTLCGAIARPSVCIRCVNLPTVETRITIDDGYQPAVSAERRDAEGK
jgi:hypothetical protein